LIIKSISKSKKNKNNHKDNLKKLLNMNEIWFLRFKFHYNFNFNYNKIHYNNQISNSIVQKNFKIFKINKTFFEEKPILKINGVAPK
jgi:hypothetical protein